ncbi:MAG: energy-coupling factor transporter transmembrane protein EcfT [Oscillospiraceae bacterium]|nr:energy-coupling factor transporter transmembrane protein EcfT [Oscillospiraceae bacterium]
MKLSDITIGQHFPGQSPVHLMDPRAKIVVTGAYIVMLFLAQNLLSLLVGAVFVLITYPASGIALRLILKSLKPVLPIIIFTGILNLFFVSGEPLWEFWRLSITAEGIRLAVHMCLRIVCLIAGSALLTYTTSPIALTDGLEALFSPLKKIKAPVHEIVMIMTITLRFIPTLIEETGKIMSAQKARGADLESGNILQRMRAMLPILIPLFVSAFRRAEELALAMESRCYHGGEGRTRLRVLAFSGVDVWAAVFTIAFVFAVVAINISGPALGIPGTLR